MFGSKEVVERCGLPGLVTDEGKQLTRSVHDMYNWPLIAKLAANKLFYIGRGGGLYSADLPP